MDDSPAATLELVGVSKRFKSVDAVVDFSLRINPGELVTLLGPSGCGKTTILRIISGLYLPDTGAVLIAGKDVTFQPPAKRDIGLVFQNYALFPHMTVARNVGYGLRMRGVSRNEEQTRVAEALELVQLAHVAERFPSQLSGGQQQRVALARAVVYRPSLLLLDEPLSNLDALLRHEMRREIRDLQRRLKITTVFVTHDQQEALTMSDQIVVMRGGRTEQLGSPDEIYKRPRTVFVAGFLGESNLWNGQLQCQSEGKHLVILDDGNELAVPPPTQAKTSDRVAVSVRPEAIRITAPDALIITRTHNRFSGTVEHVDYMGASTDYRIRTALKEIVHVVALNDDGSADRDSRIFGVGDEVIVSWERESCQVIPL